MSGAKRCKVHRVHCNDDAINDSLDTHWKNGWQLVNLVCPAGMIWAILLYEKRDDA